jgi:imidazoleglycerol phosphate dehydratase HisB
MKTIRLESGQVTDKKIFTPNDFVSHMLEHIAWRMGCSILLEWDDEEWRDLGFAFAGAIRKFAPNKREAAALGMIDDGSAEVAVELDAATGLKLESSAAIDTEYFLSLRCEQLKSGETLLELLSGIALGLDGQITILVCSLRDPHHTWEGIFRGLGTALHHIYAPLQPARNFSANKAGGSSQEGIEIKHCSCHAAQISRQTAESELLMDIDFNGPAEASFLYKGTAIDHFKNSEALAGLQNLLNMVATTCGFSMNGVFTSRALSSSHVLLEDTGMVFGRVLREILLKRMADQGINGAGSSIGKRSDISEQAVSVGISVEGRKSCLFIPLATSRDKLYRKLIIGHTVFGGLYSEDLDDFFDGFSWGFGCSIMIHCKEIPDPEEGWRQLFSNFGTALSQVLQINPSRKGVPPGVKANLF